MTDSLQEELKEFEKQLSVLLIRFMKICDAVEKGERPSTVTSSPRGPSPPRLDPLVAYS